MCVGEDEMDDLLIHIPKLGLNFDGWIIVVKAFLEWWNISLILIANML